MHLLKSCIRSFTNIYTSILNQCFLSRKHKFCFHSSSSLNTTCNFSINSIPKFWSHFGFKNLLVCKKFVSLKIYTFCKSFKMSTFDADFFGNFDENYSYIQNPAEEKDKGKSFKTVQLVGEVGAVYKSGNSGNQDQEEKISTARENMKNGINKFRVESEAEAKKEEPEKMISKRGKVGVILVLCFLVLNFVLVVVVMHRTFQISSSSTTNKLSLVLQKMEALQKENGQLKKSHEELNEHFESLSQKIVELENPEKLKNCRDAMEIFPAPRSKNQKIYPHGNRTTLEVLCDFEADGGGWTIIQKRSSGPQQEFNRNWNDYAKGFGSLEGNFWLGLDNIHALTRTGDQELRIELEDFEGNKKWAKYAHFSVSDASDFYRLTLSGFSGNGGDSLKNNTGMKFSTLDKDNDKWGGNCAENRGAGWWFNYCHGHGLLNGPYREKGETVKDFSGIMWTLWKGDFYSLAKTEMKIRKRA